MLRSRIPLLAALLLLSLGIGCAPQPPRTARLSRPMFGGTADTSAAHMAVVALVDNYGYFCSGTLITPTVVLTAAHCLEGEPVSQLQVYFGNDAYGAGDLVDVAEVRAHPSYDGDADDIGLVRLSSPSTVTPIPALPATLKLTSADVGGDMDFSGFGVTETGGDGAKLHYVGPIGLVCDGPARCDFQGNDVTPRSVAYAQTVGGPCSGDSGGPGFVTRSAQEYVASITSYGDDACTDYGVSTLVSSYESFIAGFIAGMDGGVATDAAQPQHDAAPQQDAVAPPDGTGTTDAGHMDGSGADGDHEPGSGRGCHCSTTGGRAGSGGALLLVALAVLPGRRRRAPPARRAP